jgi:hypothetical protein
LSIVFLSMALSYEEYLEDAAPRSIDYLEHSLDAGSAPK